MPRRTRPTTLRRRCSLSSMSGRSAWWSWVRGETATGCVHMWESQGKQQPDLADSQATAARRSTHLGLHLLRLAGFGHRVSVWYAPWG